MNSPQLFKNEKYEIGDISTDAINTEKITKNININQLKNLDKVDKFLEKNFSKLIKKKEQQMKSLKLNQCQRSSHKKNLQAQLHHW